MAPNNRNGLLDDPTIIESEDLNVSDKSKDTKKLELLYDGVYYDVSKWIHRHPGGNIIKMYTTQGDDATHAVQQFHHRSSKKVMGIMKSLPNRQATGNEMMQGTVEKTLRHQALNQDFLKLYKELQDEGLFEPSYIYTLIRCSEIFILLGLGLYIFHSGPMSLLRWTVSLSLLSFASGRSGWITHEGGHHSFTGRPNIDRFIESFYMGFFTGLSSRYWTSQHSRHHAGPQHIKYDVDLNTLPLVAFNKAMSKTKPKAWSNNVFIRNQKWIFYPITTFIVAIAWRYFLHPIYTIKKGKWLDFVFMLTHHVFFNYYIGVINIHICLWLSALYMFGNFTLNHTHLPVTNEPTHWVEYSLVHTMNIKSGWMNIIDYWMGYLNYQIEHHLFPTMPQFRNKLCRDRVKALAKKHGLPYHLTSYTDAVKLALKNLDNVSKELGH